MFPWVRVEEWNYKKPRLAWKGGLVLFFQILFLCTQPAFRRKEEESQAEEPFDPSVPDNVRAGYAQGKQIPLVHFEDILRGFCGLSILINGLRAARVCDAAAN